MNEKELEAMASLGKGNRMLFIPQIKTCEICGKEIICMNKGSKYCYPCTSLANSLDKAINTFEKEIKNIKRMYPSKEINSITKKHILNKLKEVIK